MTLYVCCILGPNQKLEFKLLRITEEVLAEDPWLGDASSHASDLVLKGHKSLLIMEHLPSNCRVNIVVDFERNQNVFEHQYFYYTKNLY